MALQSELERQADFTRAVIETMIDGVAVCHATESPPHVGFTIWNRAMETLTGYTMAEINRLGWYQTVYREPDVQERARARMERMRRGEDLVREEWMITRKDGARRTVEISTRVVRHDPDGPQVMAVMRDITDYKHREDEAVAARNQLAATLDAVPDLLFELDQEGRYIDFHSPREDLLAAPRDALIGKTVFEILPRDAAEICMSALREAADHGWSHGRQFELQLPHGAFWFELSVSRKSAAPDTAGRFIVLSRDITERKRLEEELRAGEFRLQSILGATADGILAVDRNGKVICANRRFAELWRIPQTLLDSNDDASLLKYVVDQLADPDAFIRKVESLYASSLEHIDTVAFKDGRTFERYTAPLLNGGEVVGRVWSFSDITARLNAEQQLRVQEERLRLSMEATRQGWFDVNVQTGVVAVSAEYARILGYEPQEFQSNLENWIASVHPDDRGALLKAYGESLATGESRQMEYRRQTRSGGWKWIRSIGRIVDWDATGKPLRMTGTHSDISEHRVAEEALRIRDNALKHAIDAVGMSDINGRLTYVNDAFVRLWRLTGPQQALGRSIVEFAKDPVVAQQTLAVVLHEGNWRGEMTAVRADGSQFEAEIAANVATDAKGNAISMMASFVDISERKRARRNLDLAVAVAQVVIWEVDFLNDRLLFDETQLPILGVNFDRSNSRIAAWIERIHAADRAEFEARVRRASAPDGEVFDYEYRMAGRDGTEQWIHSRGRVVQRTADGAPVFAVGTSMNVTVSKRNALELEQHRHRLEELVAQRTAELMATEARASHILESSADGLFGVDPVGKIVFINPAACAMLGYAPDAVIGRSAHDLFHHSRADGSCFPAAECPGQAALLSGEPRRVDNEVYWHADGHAIPVMYSMHPMMQNGVHTGTVVSVVNMTEQRAAALAREAALAAAENLARMRREFLANMSHEIRTPLNGVLGFAQIGMRNAGNAEKAHNAFEKIITSGNLLLGVINDILDFSKIDAGKVVIERAEVDLSALIDEVIDLVGPRARNRQIELRVDRAADFPRTCTGDALRLRQVLLNLLSNAVKFTETGTVTLSASMRNGRLAFAVTDTGIGMSAPQLANLFTPFSQADGSTTRKFGGTGLGLVISKALIELMGGEIRVDSRPHEGSTFAVDLPYVPSTADVARPSPAQQVAASATRRLAGISILVAEDDAFNRMLLEETLVADDGAKLLMVENGREAVAAVEREGTAAFDLVLMDLQMPEMDGFEAAKKILAIAPDLPIIGQTAHALPQDREKCIAAGMVDHIAKPINLMLLLEMVLKHARRTNRAN